MRTLEFRKQRLDPVLIGQIEHATKLLSSHTGETYLPGKSSWGRFIVARLRGIVVSPTCTDVRDDSRVTIVAVDQQGRIFLPSVRDDDRRDLFARLGLSTSAEIRELEDLVKPESGPAR